MNELPLNQIIHGDCLEVMKTFPDKSVDLVVTSPPYDNLRTYEGNLSWDFEGIAKELFRVTKDGGVVVWVVGDATVNGSETGSSFKQALYFKEIGFNLHDTMIYRKNSYAKPDRTRYWNMFEYMFVFSKGRPNSFNPLIDRKNKSFGRDTGKITKREVDGSLTERKSTLIGEFGKRENIWDIDSSNPTKDTIAHEHPAIFPDKLAEDQIKTWSNHGDTVLDPFGGSCTTGKMAKLNGRNYICIEKEEKYVNVCNERLSATTSPMF